ncbi:5-oxoprolinase subunit PxpB [Neobacillus dielmonensis]|uniref:5-oxoprolinase subunit PxpB n=1 Tax=Neobacillus dielmonensis TaxID=1347369 RepID=UPI0005AAA709|nr:5-oxoprolinase subunit PxpB [Neobacillus dielmonensis]
MMQIEPLGDMGIRIKFGNIISEDIHREIQQFTSQLKDKPINGIIEWVPSYTNVAIYYQPDIISYSDLITELNTLYERTNKVEPFNSTVYEIPVYYGGEAGPDFSFIADSTGVSEEEVIRLHSSQVYLIYMMGFVPGFPYLGGLPNQLAVPRLPHPRPSVLPGSVGIGGNQTGIYPSEVPSGWRIIGRTPVKLFDIEDSPPVLLEAGNYLKFCPIDEAEFHRIKQLADEQKYTVTTYKRMEAR